MNKNSDTRLYGLIGNPVSNSLSPMIHNNTFEELNLNGTYLAFEIAKENLKLAVDSMKVFNAKGFNVTIPFKEDIIKYLDEVDISAKEMKAVNTVLNRDGKLIGYNTDGMGFLSALKTNGVRLEDAKILIIGAGGAARGISFALAHQDINRLDILNRGQERALNLIEDLKNLHKDKNFEYIGQMPSNPMEYDIVINASSIGMEPDTKISPIEPSLFNNRCVFCDIVYKPHLTEFLKRAKDLGRTVIFGIDMLIYQALLSEEIWNEIEIDKLKISNKIKMDLGLK